MVAVGEIHKSKLYGDVIVLEYNNSSDVLVKFLESGYERKVSSNNLSLGKVCDKSVKRRNPSRAKTFTQFLLLAKSMHGDTYDYIESTYKNMGEKLSIVCSVHGVFYQSAEKHCIGQRCTKCATLKTSLSQTRNQEDFIKQSTDVHGSKYTYHNVVYSGAHKKVSIGCKVHGEFQQTPASHYSGNGCPKCGRKGWFKPSKESKLYILATEGLVKVGVTNNSPAQRIANMKCETGLQFNLIKCVSVGITALKVEQEILKTLRQIYQPSPLKFNGSTECFECKDINKVVSVVDSTINKWSDK